MNDNTKMTSEEWAEINATIFVEKQREVIGELLRELLPQNDAIDQRDHWTRCFIASCLGGGDDVDDAISKGRAVADRLFVEN